MDTWGISGTTFLVIYGVVLVGVGAVVFAIRRRLSRPSEGAGLDTWRCAELGPYEVAMLTGGESLLSAVAACKLKEDGHLTLGGAGELTVAAGIPHRADPVESWVYDAVRGDPKRARKRLGGGPPEGVIAPIQQHLWALGLLLEPRQRRLIRTQLLWFVPVLGIGIARLIAGMNNHRPIGFLFLLLLAGAYGAYVLTKPPIATRAGRDVLTALKHDPSALGSCGYAADVALSGVKALWMADAALAASLGLKRATGGSFYGGGGCGGGGCGGGCGG